MFTLGSLSIFTLTFHIDIFTYQAKCDQFCFKRHLAGPVQVVRNVLTFQVCLLLVGLELSFLPPEFFPGIALAKLDRLALKPLGLLSVLFHLVLDHVLGDLLVSHLLGANVVHPLMHQQHRYVGGDIVLVGTL